MDDRQVLSRVDDLVAEEHGLRELPSRTPEQQARLAHIEEDLDQCWDLLRQRRARREFGQNPDDARARPHSQLDDYLQ